MLQKYNRWTVLNVFFDNPEPTGAGFQLREISRISKLAPTSVKKYLDELIEDGLVIKSEHRVHQYPVYWANRDNEKFKSLKKIDMIFDIQNSGLLTLLHDTCMPEVIILFGSASRGEDLKESDIDLFLLCEETKLNLEQYETLLKRKINIFYCNNFDTLSEELKNNIINGVVLNGYLKVFQ